MRDAKIITFYENKVPGRIVKTLVEFPAWYYWQSFYRCNPSPPTEIDGKSICRIVTVGVKLDTKTVGVPTVGVKLDTRSDGCLFYSARLKANSKVKKITVRDLFFAADAAS